MPRRKFGTRPAMRSEKAKTSLALERDRGKKREVQGWQRKKDYTGRYGENQRTECQFYLGKGRRGGKGEGTAP